MVIVPFYKVESVGNDFVLLHEREVESLAAALAEPARGGGAAVAQGVSTELLSRLAVAMCERRFGVGSDGLLVLAAHAGGLQMRMFNPDGTEDFCGNGLRCVAAHAHRLGWVGEEFIIRHGGREVEARVFEDGVVETVIGSASYEPSRVPHTGPAELFDVEVVPGHRGSALTTGSTHLVLQVANLPADEELFALGPRLEHDPRFPARTSVIWTREAGADKLEIRIWERGAGETLGCGTGASAAAADYLRRMGRGGTVEVRSRGGALSVSADAWDAPLKVRGRVEEMYSGEFLWER